MSVDGERASANRLWADPWSSANIVSGNGGKDALEEHAGPMVGTKKHFRGASGST